MSADAPLLSAEAWNPVIEGIVEECLAMVDWLVKELYASGGPPGTYPRDPLDQYRMLVQMRAADDARFWENPRAIAALEQLSKRFGPPPPVPVPAVQPMLPPPIAPVAMPGLLGGMNA